jgi:hypothetical protein
MEKKINITVENKLLLDKRDMNVYHHSTRSAYMISYDSAITLPLRPLLEDDYVHISVVSGPGHLENNSVVNLPSWVDFEFSSRGDVIVTHCGDRTLLKIPPGPPTWQLKMTPSVTSLSNKLSDHIIVCDEQLGDL